LEKYSPFDYTYSAFDFVDVPEGDFNYVSGKLNEPYGQFSIVDINLADTYKSIEDYSKIMNNNCGITLSLYKYIQ